MLLGRHIGTVPYLDQRPMTPQRHMTQKDQDEFDEKARKRALNDLVQGWQDRLQLISLITTFFASMEAGMLEVSKPDGSPDDMSIVEKFTSASFTGALVMHCVAAIVSFLTSFLLIRYKLQQAKKQEAKIEHYSVDGDRVVESPRSVHNSPLTTIIASELRHPVSHLERDLEKGDYAKEVSEQQQQTSGRISEDEPTSSTKVIVTPQDEKSSPSPSPAANHPATPRHISEPPLFSADPHLEQVSVFGHQPPAHLLSRFHTFCVFIAALGFALAIFGIVAYAWSRLGNSIGIFTSASLFFCLVGIVALPFWPDRKIGISLLWMVRPILARER